VLFAAGAVVLLVRKSGHNGWGDFARVAVVFVPATVLSQRSNLPRRSERGHGSQF
jgi:hypothetical protein